MSHQELIQKYLSGVEELRDAIAGLTEEQLDLSPGPGDWSFRQVVCHLADFEPIYADRIKRILAEEEARLIPGDPDLFAAHLVYDKRDVKEELNLIEAVRKQLGRILLTRESADFQKLGVHLVEGPLSVEELLRRITNHIPHHVRFLREKRKNLESWT